MALSNGAIERRHFPRGRTFGDLFALVDFGNLFLEEFVAFVTEGENLGSFDAPACDSGEWEESREAFEGDRTTDSLEDLVRDLSSGLVFGQSVGVVQRVVCLIIVNDSIQMRRDIFVSFCCSFFAGWMSAYQRPPLPPLLVKSCHRHVDR